MVVGFTTCLSPLKLWVRTSFIFIIFFFCMNKLHCMKIQMYKAWNNFVSDLSFTNWSSRIYGVQSLNLGKFRKIIFFRTRRGHTLKPVLRDLGKNMNIHITMMVNLKYNCQVKPVLRDHSYCHLSREVYSTEQRKSDDILMWTRTYIETCLERPLQVETTLFW
jgi:hypothetical protein